MTDTQQDSNSTNVDLEVFKQVCEHYRKDMRLFWTRSNFYLAIQGGLISVFAILAASVRLPRPFLQVMIAITGLVIAGFWYLSARATTYWLKRWRSQVIKANKELADANWYGEIVDLIQSEPRKISSNITKYMPLALALIWLVLGIHAVLEAAH